MTYTLHCGDNLAYLRTMASDSVDSVVTDPPYELGFMGKKWDASGIAHSVELWAEVLRVLKPGGRMLAFAGTRTYHRMTCAIEDAGFEVTDMVNWVFGSGFPKSLDISKALDKAAGAEREVVSTGAPVKRMIPGADQDRTGSWLKDDGREFVPSITAPATDAARQWEGWGTALKPAHEPICLARKPLIGTYAENAQAHGTGGLNIDGCRVAHVTVGGGSLALNPHLRAHIGGGNGGHVFGAETERREGVPSPLGRFPANLIHDGSDLGLGEAARFFYSSKASRSDRGEGNTHATVKPTDLMRYLCRLVTPPGGIVLDPFNGSGSTGKAAVLEGFRYLGLELSPEYVAISRARIDAALPAPVGWSPPGCRTVAACTWPACACGANA